MARKLLIDRNDFRDNRRDISDSSYNSGRLDQQIDDAQYIDIRELMGADFYDDMIRNCTSTAYKALLNAGTYLYNGSTYDNYGLKSVIVLYAYGRYMVSGSVVDTPFGMVEKNATDSDRVSIEKKKTESKINQQSAFSFWLNIKNFLDRNNSDYPLWNVACVKRPSGSVTFRKIGG